MELAMLADLTALVTRRCGALHLRRGRGDVGELPLDAAMAARGLLPSVATVARARSNASPLGWSSLLRAGRSGSRVAPASAGHPAEPARRALHALATPRSLAAAAAATPAATFAAAPRRHVHATPPPHGIFSSVGDTYQKMKLDKEVAQASEAFALTLNTLVDLPRAMDADAYLSIVQAGKAAAGLDGWRASLPWVASSAAVAEVTEVEKMIAAMTPAERRQVRLLGGAATRRVAATSGVEAAKVGGLVRNVQTMAVLQKWLRKRKAAGRALPKTRKELQVMMAAPGSGATMHMHAQRG